MGTGHHESEGQHSVAGRSARNIEGWEFGSPREERDPGADASSLNARTKPDGGKRSNEDVDGWVFGTTNEPADRPPESAGSVGSVGSAEARGDPVTISGTIATDGDRTVSGLETRLAPVVALVVVGSLLFTGGYILLLMV